MSYLTIADQLDTTIGDDFQNLPIGPGVDHALSIGGDVFVAGMMDGAHFRAVIGRVVHEKPAAGLQGCQILARQK